MNYSNSESAADDSTPREVALVPSAIRLKAASDPTEREPAPEPSGARESVVAPDVTLSFLTVPTGVRESATAMNSPNGGAVPFTHPVALEPSSPYPGHSLVVRSQTGLEYR